MYEIFSATIASYVVCILGGLFIELFFKLIRYRDSFNKSGPIPKYQPINYMTVTEYMSSGEGRWLRYVGFRTLPPIIIFILLAAILEAYFPQSNILYGLSVAGLASIIFRDGKSLFNKKITISEKLIHLTNIFLVFLSATIVWILALALPLSELAPSIAGIVDNLWSSLFVATLVVLYLDATNIRAEARPDRAEKIARDNYIVKEYTKIQAKFGAVIKSSSSKYNTSEPLLYSVLIYESMNRPSFLRAIENVIVRFPGIVLTVGIAQVKSSRPLTDEESIRKSAAILKGTNAKIAPIVSIRQNPHVQKAVKKYNPDSQYYENIIQIFESLQVYAPVIFSK